MIEQTLQASQAVLHILDRTLTMSSPRSKCSPPTVGAHGIVTPANPTELPFHIVLSTLFLSLSSLLYFSTFRFLYFRENPSNQFRRATVRRREKNGCCLLSRIRRSCVPAEGSRVSASCCIDIFFSDDGQEPSNLSIVATGSLCRSVKDEGCAVEHGYRFARTTCLLRV